MHLLHPMTIPQGTLEAHEAVRILRLRGWTYEPWAHHPWRRGFHFARTADEAIAFERREDATDVRWGRK